MAFFPPRYNVWARVFRMNDDLDAYLEVGYSRCQVRGTDSKQEAEANVVSSTQVLFPRGTDVRGPANSRTGIPDIIFVAGYGRNWLQIRGICDKGAGFPNEYRLANCWFQAITGWPLPVTPDGLTPVSTTLVPPDGYTPVPILSPGDVWPVFPLP